jgi:hypothetical protein
MVRLLNIAMRATNDVVSAELHRLSCPEKRADCSGDPCKYPNDTGTRCHPVAAVVRGWQPEQCDILLAALKRAREGLYNGFEPDNQSRLYRDIDDVIKRAGAERAASITRSAIRDHE